MIVLPLFTKCPDRGSCHSSVDSLFAFHPATRVRVRSTPSMLLSIYIDLWRVEKTKINKKRPWLAHKNQPQNCWSWEILAPPSCCFSLGLDAFGRNLGSILIRQTRCTYGTFDILFRFVLLYHSDEHFRVKSLSSGFHWGKNEKIEDKFNLVPKTLYKTSLKVGMRKQKD